MAGCSSESAAQGAFSGRWQGWRCESSGELSVTSRASKKRGSREAPPVRTALGSILLQWRVGNCRRCSRELVANHNGLVLEERALTRGPDGCWDRGLRVGVVQRVAAGGRRISEHVAALRAEAENGVNDALTTDARRSRVELGKRRREATAGQDAA